MSKGQFIRYTAAQLAFLSRRRRLPRKELHAAFVARFRRRDVTPDHIKALCTRRGWKTGRTGCFEKGLVPWNTGKKRPYNANSARTQFKKGILSGRAKLHYKQIGCERVSHEGYIERKINNDRPFCRRWRGVHILNWEAKNGPLPKGHCLKCLDGNKSNTAAYNWLLVDRAMLPRLNGKSGRDYDHAPAELKPSILAVAQLEHRLRSAAAEREDV